MSRAERTSVGEYVLWRGRPREVSLSGAHRALYWTLLVVAACATAMLVAAALTVGVRSPALLVFAAWCVSFAMGLRWVPEWWQRGAEYLVTDQRVLLKRGRFGRSIGRTDVSFARIRWSSGDRQVGDLELVRDVPTGALRRRLTLVLRGIERPDLVWDVIRGRDPESLAPRRTVNGGPLSQRLDEGERVIWYDRPVTSWRRFVPATGREVAAVAVTALTCFAVIRTVRAAVPAAKHVLQGGVSAGSPAFIALIAALSLSTALMLGVGAGTLWTAVLRPALLQRSTRYWITNRRVLIACGDDELHLERSRIVDVIDAPAEAGHGSHDLFLILDGPRASAVAAQGAFGEASASELRPVLRGVADAASVEQILRETPLAA